MSTPQNQPSTLEGKPSEVKLLDEIVRALIRQHDISKEEMEEREGGLESRVGRIAFEKACGLAPPTLGRIVCAVPSADLYGQQNGTWLGKYEQGPYLLQQIAATTMLAHMDHLLGIREHVPVWWLRHYSPERFGPVPNTNTV